MVGVDVYLKPQQLFTKIQYKYLSFRRAYTIFRGTFFFETCEIEYPGKQTTMDASILEMHVGYMYKVELVFVDISKQISNDLEGITKYEL